MKSWTFFILNDVEKVRLHVEIMCQNLTKFQNGQTILSFGTLQKAFLIAEKKIIFFSSGYNSPMLFEFVRHLQIEPSYCFMNFHFAKIKNQWMDMFFSS